MAWRLPVPIVLLAVVTLAAPNGFCQGSANERVSIEELLSELYAQMPWYYRWVEANPKLYRRLPREMWGRIHRSESDIWNRRSKAAQQLGDLGTNGWPAIPALVEGVVRDISVGVLAASALGRMDVEKSPAWEDIQKRVAGQDPASRAFRYIAFGQDGYGRPYELSQRRFALLGLGAVGTTAAPALPNVLELLKTEEDRELWAPAVMALSKISADGKAVVPLLTDILLDTRKYPNPRMSAADALASIVPPAPETLEALRTAMRDELGLVRGAAARALWRLNGDGQEVLPTVEALLNHKLKTVRLAALNVLSEMGSSAEPCRGAIERLARDENEAVRHLAAAVWERLGRRSP